jgi:CxxC motif-containing protein
LRIELGITDVSQDSVILLVFCFFQMRPRSRGRGEGCPKGGVQGVDELTDPNTTLTHTPRG